MSHFSARRLRRLAGAAGGVAALCLAVRAQNAPVERSNVTLNGLQWRLVGPAYMSGRITDVEVPRGEPYTIYCAAATGGVWKSVNNGTTWAPIFDHEGSGSIGDVAIAPSNPNIVWVGTGEANGSSYSSWGDGVYKSVTGGQTWTRMGLRDTQHIGRIVIDPIDPDVVYVAAVGHLWGSNAERGLFKTTDGGRTWRKSKFISDTVGFIDVVMDPADNRTLYAAAYGRRADRFDDFDSLSINVLPGGGIYKTTDAGETWVPLEGGLPSTRVGRIGLDVSRSNPNIVYAVVERDSVKVTLPPSERAKVQQWLAANAPVDAADRDRMREIVEHLAAGDRAAVVVNEIGRTEQIQLRALLDQGELDTGGGVFRSDDKGRTWRRMNKLNDRAAYYSQIRVDPRDPDRIYVLLVRTWESTDGGRTLQQNNWAVSSFLTSNFIHGDFHAMWIDPQSSAHLIVGSDGGPYSSYDRGATWEAHRLPIGQFVAVAVDMRRPYYIYGGLQDNGTWGGPSATRHVSGVTDHDWFKVSTSDGAFVQVDPTDDNTVYNESQYANLVRVDIRTGQRKSIRPRGGEPTLRFNYVVPFIISPHAPRTLYIGGQRVLKSTDRGDHWAAVSGDLSKNEPAPLTGEGATITTLAESPIARGMLVAGTDDGNVQITRDDGKTWANVSARIPGLPKDRSGRPNIWVSRVELSHFEAGTIYASFDGHRDDDLKTYLYRTLDFGQTWKSVAANLPSGAPVRVVREDVKNPSVLFAGTEAGVWVSVDKGERWQRLDAGLPTVRVDDLVIHPRDLELVAGTHGRSLYVLDISPIEQLTPEAVASELHLFTIKTATLFAVDVTRNRGASGFRRFAAPNPYTDLAEEGDTSGMAPSGATIFFYARAAASDPANVTILDRENRVIRQLTAPVQAGINRVLWDLRGQPLPPPPAWSQLGSNDSVRLARRVRPGALVAPGEYQVRLVSGGREVRGTVRVEPDHDAQR